MASSEKPSNFSGSETVAPRVDCRLDSDAAAPAERERVRVAPRAVVAIDGSVRCRIMATYVRVHGAWGGSYGWRRVRPLLQQAGHAVFTPSLTGQGERAHLA